VLDRNVAIPDDSFAQPRPRQPFFEESKSDEVVVNLQTKRTMVTRQLFMDQHSQILFDTPLKTFQSTEPRDAN